MVSTRTLVAYVEDRPGVLNRVASLFRRRDYNIVSLNVGQTHEPGVSRMTIVVEADADMARRIQANLYKLVHVISVEDITDLETVTRDLALIKVRAAPEQRAEILQICEVYRARTVDLAEDTVIIEISGRPLKLDGILNLLRPFGIEEMVQSGSVAMTRGPIGNAATALRQANTARDTSAPFPAFGPSTSAA